MSKQERDVLRSELRKARSKLPLSVVDEFSGSICQNALRLLDKSEHIAGYYAFGSEADPARLMTALSERGKRVYVPIVLPEFKMRFAPVDENTPLILNRYGIKEPQVDSALFVEPSQLDTVLVPLVGFDRQCNRMGMGGGYYDRCFAHRNGTSEAPLLIGIAFDLQYADTVYAQNWDVPLDHIVTQSGIISAAP